MEIWATVLQNHYMAYLTRPFLEWLDDGISSKNIGRIPGNNRCLFAIVLWCIWKWRNDASFNNRTIPIHARSDWFRTNQSPTGSAATGLRFRKPVPPTVANQTLGC
nr:uncharacterized protein LOC109192823 [Ipomoea batatas]